MEGVAWEADKEGGHNDRLRTKTFMALSLSPCSVAGPERVPSTPYVAEEQGWLRTISAWPARSSRLPDVPIVVQCVKGHREKRSKSPFRSVL